MEVEVEEEDEESELSVTLSSESLESLVRGRFK